MLEKWLQKKLTLCFVIITLYLFPLLSRSLLWLLCQTNQICGLLWEVPPPPDALLVFARMLFALQFCLSQLHVPERIWLRGRSQCCRTQNAESPSWLKRVQGGTKHWKTEERWLGKEETLKFTRNIIFTLNVHERVRGDVKDFMFHLLIQQEWVVSCLGFFNVIHSEWQFWVGWLFAIFTQVLYNSHSRLEHSEK